MSIVASCHTHIRAVRTRRLIAVAAATVALVAAGALPAAGVGPFGPAQVAVSGCEQDGLDADIAADGTTRGFAGCGDYYAPAPIKFFRARPGSAPISEGSPYTGRVLAAAWDGVDSTYVLYAAGGSLFLGKRVGSNRVDSTHTYAKPIWLSSSAADVLNDGDVIASAGKWWVVWSEPTAKFDEWRGVYFWPPRQLFQRHTLLGAQGKTQITRTPAPGDNIIPKLAYAAGKVTMVWARRMVPEFVGGSYPLPMPYVQLATSTGGAWTSRVFSSTPAGDFDPDLTVYAGVTFVSWNRGPSVLVSSNVSGRFVSRILVQPGYTWGGTSVAVSGRHLFVGGVTGAVPYPLFVEERAGAVWSGLALGPGSHPVVLAQGGKARIVYWADDAIRIQTQV